MHQLDTNRFSTFGNEMEQSAYISSQRNHKPSSFRNAASENNNYQELSRNESEAILRRSQPERLSLEDHGSEGNENYRKESLEYLEENIPKQLQGVERSLENTGKTVLSKASGSEANDLRNTLSLFFPCDYFVPESFGSTAIDNKTILEVTESEREKEKAKECPKGGNSYPMSRREGQPDIYDKSIETLRDLNKMSGREGYISDRIVSVDRHSERTKMTDDSAKGRSSSCEKSYLLNEFKSLRKEVVAIQKDFKMSENYNRKLEGQIYNQNNQILQILQNFASLKEENGTLKNQLGPKKVIPEPKETQRSSRINVKDHAHIDHIVSKKANRYYKEEIQFIKSKYEKIVKNHECIIKDLQNQLKMRDMELEEAKRLNEKENKKMEESANPVDSHCYKARSDVVSHRDLSGENGRFYTPSRSKPLAEINSSNSYDRFAESKGTRSFVEGASSTSYNNPKHAMNLLKDLQKTKEQDKENIQKDHLKRSDKKVSASKSSASFMSNYNQIHSLPHNRISENQLRQSQSQRDNKMRDILPPPVHCDEEDGKKSLADISFDASYMKDNMEKRLLESELTSLNISPAKEHDWKFKSNNNMSLKSKKPIHNISQFNEISIIKEQPSENFITDSIQTKIFTELQSSQADSNKRCTTEEREINVYKNSLKENRGYSENREGKRKSRLYPEDHYKPGNLPVANLSKNKDYYERPKITGPAENNYQNMLAGMDQNQRKKSSRRALEPSLKSERVHQILPTHQLPGDPFEYESGEYPHKKAQRFSSGYQVNAGGERNLKRSHNQSNEFDSQLEKYLPLQNQNNNDTIINLNNALEEMLENDQLRISHQKQKSKKESELSHKRKDQELEKLKMQSRSRSSGHQRKRSNPNLQNSNLYIGTNVIQSSKGPLDSSSHRVYEEAFEGEDYAQSKIKSNNHSSRRNLYTPYEMDSYMKEPAQDSGYLKAKRDVYSHGSQKSTTPQSRVPMSNKYRSDSSMYSQTPVVREEKLPEKKLHRGSSEVMHKGFENYGTKESHKRDSTKYGGGYKIDSFHEQVANDYQPKSKDTKRQQQSINDYVNFESALQQQERGDLNVNQSSFALFQEKYSHTNFDSVNSSTLFEAFPLRKSQAHKEGEFLIGNFTKPKYF